MSSTQWSKRRPCWLILLLFAFLCAGCSRMAKSSPRIITSEPGPMCADANASAFVWEDLNANGVRDEGEPPLAGVCIAVGRQPMTGQEDWIPGWCGQAGTQANKGALTNAEGKWWSSSFVAGACGEPEEVAESMKSQCNSVYIMALPGPGYRVTTEEWVRGCQAEFGVVRR